MNNNLDDHLTEEQIMEYVTCSGKSKFQEHVDKCDKCSREVQELREVSLTLKNIENEEVPSVLQRKIFHSLYSGRSGISNILGSPFLPTVIAIFAMIVLYFIIGTLLVNQ